MKLHNHCHVCIGGFPLCTMPMSDSVIDKARSLRVIPTCGHVSYRDAVIVATLLDEAGRGNVTVVAGKCPEGYGNGS